MNIINFSFENSSVPVLNLDGNSWWQASIVTSILGFKNSRQALLTHVDSEDVQKMDTLTSGGKQKAAYVNESGLYALIFGSTKPEAKRFKRWVTGEVLPSIRKTGNYISNRDLPAKPSIPLTPIAFPRLGNGLHPKSRQEFYNYQAMDSMRERGNAPIRQLLLQLKKFDYDTYAIELEYQALREIIYQYHYDITCIKGIANREPCQQIMHK